MAAPTQVVGEAGIIIRPVTTKFESDLQAVLNRAGNSAFQIPVTIGTAAFEEGIGKLKGAAESGIVIPVGAAAGAAEEAVGAVKGSAESGVAMPLVVNAAQAELTIGSIKGAAQAGADMPLYVDTTQAEQSLGAIKGAAEQGVDVPIRMGDPGMAGGPDGEVSQFGNAIATAGGLIKSYGLQAAGALGLTYGFARAMGQVKASVFGFNQQLEQARIGFETMFGSADLANQKIEEFKVFARQTPFEFPDILTGAQRLKSFGFETEQIVPMLTKIGDASAALGQGSYGIEKIIRALGQMQAKGKAAGEEFLQLQEMGIPAMQYIAEATGKTTQELQKLQQKGLLDSKTAIDGILAGLQKNFGGLMAKQAQTFQGAMSNVKDSINQVLASIGEPLYKRIAAIGVNLGNFLSEISKAFGEGGFKKAFDVLAKSIGGPLEGSVRSILSSLYDLTESIKKIIGEIVKGVGPVLTSAAGAIVVALRAVLDVVEPVVTAIASAGPAIRVLAAAVTAFVVVSKVRNLGIVQSLIDFGKQAAAATEAQKALTLATEGGTAAETASLGIRGRMAEAYAASKAQSLEAAAAKRLEAQANKEFEAQLAAQSALLPTRGERRAFEDEARRARAMEQLAAANAEVVSSNELVVASDIERAAVGETTAAVTMAEVAATEASTVASADRATVAAAGVIALEAEALAAEAAAAGEAARAEALAAGLGAQIADTVATEASAAVMATSALSAEALAFATLSEAAAAEAHAVAEETRTAALAAGLGTTVADTLATEALTIAMGEAALAAEALAVAEGEVAVAESVGTITSAVRAAGEGLAALGAKVAAIATMEVSAGTAVVGIIAGIVAGAYAGMQAFKALEEAGAKAAAKTEASKRAAYAGKDFAKQNSTNIGDIIGDSGRSFEELNKRQQALNEKAQAAQAIIDKRTSAGQMALRGLQSVGLGIITLGAGAAAPWIENAEAVAKAKGAVKEYEKESRSLDKEFAKQTVGWGRLSVAIGRSTSSLDMLGAKQAKTPEEVARNTGQIQNMLEASFRGRTGKDPNNKELAAIAKQAASLGKYDLPSLQSALGAAGIDLKTFTGTSEQLAQKLDEAAAASDRGAAAAVGLGSGFADVASRIKKATEDGQKFAELVYAQTNFWLSGIKATQDWSNALGELNKRQDFTVSKLQALTSAAQGQIAATYASAYAATDQANASRSASDQLDKTAVATQYAAAKQDELRNAFIETASKAGYARDQAVTLANALFGIPSAINIDVNLNVTKASVDAAVAAVAGIAGKTPQQVAAEMFPNGIPQSAAKAAGAQRGATKAEQEQLIYNKAYREAVQRQEAARKALADAESASAAATTAQQAAQAEAAKLVAKENKDKADKAVKEASKKPGDDAAKAQEERVRAFLEAVKKLQDGTEAMKQSFAGIVTSLQQRRNELMGNLRERTQLESGVSVARIIKNTQERTRLLSESQKGLAELQSKGLSPDAIRSLGLTGTAEQAKVIRRLLKASPDELRKLSSQVGTLSDTAQQAAYREQGTIIAGEIRKALDAWVEAGGTAKLSVGDISTIIQNSKGDPNLIAAGIADKLGGVAKR